MTLEEFWDEVYGPVGTPKRDREDRNMERRMRGYDLMRRSLWLAQRLVITRPFATVVWAIHEGTTIRGVADALAFEYLGDFLFWGKPMTQDYADSWMARVRLPRWMRYRRRP